MARRPRQRALAGALLTALAFTTAACLEAAGECRGDADCDGRSMCLAGSCQPLSGACGVDSDCASEERCLAGLCLLPGRCMDDEHCEADERCSTGYCVPRRCEGSECPEGSRCQLGECVAYGCEADEDCEPGLVCDPVDGVCKLANETPAQERCNAIDDDLDGLVDEGFSLGEPCSLGLGACEAAGERVCDDDELGSHCDASPAAPSLESCNGIDDDCDGEVDESFPKLGLACVEGLGACTATGQLVCLPDGGGTTCDAEGPAPLGESCNGIDDDCDGEVDEDFPELGAACVGGLAPCEHVGWWACEDREIVCVPGLDPYPYPDGCP